MSKPSDSTTKGALAFSLWAGGTFLFVLALSFTGLFASWDRAFTDVLFQWRIAAAPLPVSPRLFPVDLNDSAERNLGAAVGTRQAFADLFTVLGDGKLSASMDFLFAGARDPQGDAAMVKAAQQMDGLILAIVPVDPGTSAFSGREFSAAEADVLRSHLWHPRVINAGAIPAAETFLLPNLELAKATRYLGHIGVHPDTDGIYRKTALFYRWEDGYMPSLPLAQAAYFLKVDPAAIVVNAGSYVELPTKAGPVRISVDNEGYAWIPYPADWKGAWKRTPMDKVTAGATDPDAEADILQLFDGGLVMVADLTTTHKDFGPTAFERIYPLSGIHSSLLNGLLTGKTVSHPDPWFEALVVALLLAATVWVSRWKRAVAAHVAFAAVLLLLLAGSLVLWFVGLTVPWFVAPAVAVAAAWLAATLLRLFKSYEQRTLMESALSRYLPRALASRMLVGGNVALEPKDRDLTLMFSDISGFTKWSSDKPADLVHSFLSDYLESMVQIIFAHGGTVDKFMGDGILAFFGDPFEMPDHAERCVRAALAMQVRVQELAEKWAEPAGITLKVRVGVNSGRVIVGNLGSMTKVEYTVIGSAVNLAQRMESNAPLGGVLVTDETYQRIKHRFRFKETIEVKVKGYDVGIPAHVVESELS